MKIGQFFWHDFVEVTGAIPTLIRFRPRFIYENEAAKKRVKGSALIIANHESYLDPVKMMVALWYRRVYFVATSKLFESKFSNWFFHKMLCIPVNKENFNFQTFRDVSAALSEKRVVGIFPEGGLSQNEGTSVSPFKGGVVLMALKNHAPIIPMYLGKTPHWYSKLTVVIGEPIMLEKEGTVTMGDVEAIAQKLHEKEEELSSRIKSFQSIH